MQQGVHHQARKELVKKFMYEMLDNIPKYGSFTGACEATDINPRTFLRWRRKYPIYENMVQRALFRRADKLKDVAYDWAISGIRT